MSRIEELIKEKCPNEVEYKRLKDICEIKTGKGITIKECDKCGLYPIISGGILPMGYCNKFNRRANTVTISRAGTAGYVNYIYNDFYLNDKCFSIIPINDMNERYLYYALKNMQNKIYSLKSYGTVPTVTTKKIGKVKIPIPPIEVQEEIVRILDKFSELEAELEAELEVRKKQYEFWRDKILNPQNANNVCKLSEIASVKARIGWQGLTKSEYLTSGDYYLITGVDFKNGAVDLKGCYYIDKKRYIQDRNIQVKNDDVLVTKDGTLGKVAYVDNLDKPATLNSGVFVVRSTTNKITNKFLYHYLRSSYLMNYAKTRITGGTIKHLNQNIMIDVPVPIFPLEVQNKIVNILDKFDKLINNINEGIPAEIEARRKQYEYYRNKLLSFDEESN